MPLKNAWSATALFVAAVSFSCLPANLSGQSSPADSPKALTGQAAFTDYTREHPGVRRHLTVADLPAPYASESVSNDAFLVPRPEGAWPQAPPGFKVQLYADGFMNARLLRTAPNGDLFLADCQAGDIIVLRGVGKDGKAAQVETFASDLTLPFGINFYPSGQNPQWVYVANTDSVVRFPYRNGDLKARGPAEMIIDNLPGYARLHGGGHWTHDIVFSKDGNHMLVSVGSRTNVADTDNNPADFHRAAVLEYTPSGNFERVYADGIRNCVGEAVNPTTGAMLSAITWCRTTSPTFSRADFTAGRGTTWAAIKTLATPENTPSCRPRCLPPTSFSNRTLPLSKCSSTLALNSQAVIEDGVSPPNTGHGTRPIAPATKSLRCP